MSRKIYTQFNPPPSHGSPCGGESRTRQEFLKESLTSTIIDRFTKTGVLVPPGMPRRSAIFGDFTNLPETYQDAFALAQRVRDAFATLPSAVRERFNNNPLELHVFLSDERNRSEAISLGLIENKAAEAAKPEPQKAAEPALAQA